MDNASRETTLREIKKKMLILSGRKPYAAGVRDFAAHVEKKDWLQRNLRLEGSSVTPEQVESLLDGGLLPGASVWEHLLAQRLENLLGEMHDLISRGIDIDLKLISTFHNMLSGDSAEVGTGYRKRSITIEEYDYVAPLAAELEQEMKRLDARIEEAERLPAGSIDCFEAAARIHDGLLAIFPYGRDDKLLARAVTAYYLLGKGYPAVVPDLSEEKYNRLVSRALSAGDHGGMTDAFLAAVRERTELLLQLTAY